MKKSETLPSHGRLDCSRCFSGGEENQQIGNWRMRRDPGSWGSSQPTFLVLGFSKGATQADIYANGVFDDVAFGGEITRRNLTNILRSVSLLNNEEIVDEKIRPEEREFHFASLVRCSLSRYDEKESMRRGRPVYATSGPLITKSFNEIPCIISQCTDQFLTTLPKSLKVIIVLGVTDSYVRNFREKMRELHPEGFHVINPVAYANYQLLWVHLTHPSKGNGTLNAWLTRGCEDTSGRKRELAIEAITKYWLNHSRDNQNMERQEQRLNKVNTITMTARKLRYIVKRGNAVGTVLTPHLHEDGNYVVSLTRFEKDYIRVKGENELPDWVKKGYSVRMSNSDVRNQSSPSLITPNSIEIYEG